MARAVPTPNAPRRGNDAEAVVNISFEEAAKGCKKNISYHKIETCPTRRQRGGKGTSAHLARSVAVPARYMSAAHPLALFQTSRGLYRSVGHSRGWSEQRQRGALADMYLSTCN